MKTSVTKLFGFEAAHHLPNYDGACRNLHGHSYKLEVEIEGTQVQTTHPSLGKKGMIMDFSEMKRIVTEGVIDDFNHSNLNDFFDMPTAENIVQDIFKRIEERLNTIYYELIRVRLWETLTSYAEVKI